MLDPSILLMYGVAVCFAHKWRRAFQRKRFDYQNSNKNYDVRIENNAVCNERAQNDKLALLIKMIVIY